MDGTRGDGNSLVVDLSKCLSKCEGGVIRPTLRCFPRLGMGLWQALREHLIGDSVSALLRAAAARLVVLIATEEATNLRN